jgi:hypothetical protein
MKRRAIFDTASVAVLRPFVEAQLDTKRRDISFALTASIFEAICGPFVEVELTTK